MSTEPIKEAADAVVSMEALEVAEVPGTIIFEDISHPPLLIRDPKSASLIFRPTGQGCFP